MNKLRTVAALFLLPAYSGISMASPAIGVATGFETITLNKAAFRGNATLFDGNTFAAGADGARMNLNGGTSLRLGALSQGSVYRDRLKLNSGAAEIHTSGSYSVDALSLRVRNSGQNSIARVLISSNRVRVGALSGSLQVLNGQGLLIATVAEGSATDFTPEGASAASGASSGSGAASGSGTASGGTGAGGAGASASGAAATTAGVAATHTALIIAGVVVAGAGLATGVAVAANSGSSSTLSPSAR